MLALYNVLQRRLYLARLFAHIYYHRKSNVLSHLRIFGWEMPLCRLVYTPFAHHSRRGAASLSKWPIDTLPSLSLFLMLSSRFLFTSFYNHFPRYCAPLTFVDLGGLSDLLRLGRPDIAWPFRRCRYHFDFDLFLGSASADMLIWYSRLAPFAAFDDY